MGLLRSVVRFIESMFVRAYMFFFFGLDCLFTVRVYEQSNAFSFLWLLIFHSYYHTLSIRFTMRFESLRLNAFYIVIFVINDSNHFVGIKNNNSSNNKITVAINVESEKQFLSHFICILIKSYGAAPTTTRRQQQRKLLLKF